LLGIWLLSRSQRINRAYKIQLWFTRVSHFDLNYLLIF
jgi:hypothetical protein